MPSNKAESPLVYSVHPSVQMIQNWVAALPEKTGRTLDQWIELIQREGPTDRKELRAWIKQTAGLGTNAAWWLAERAAGDGWMEETPEAYLQTAVGYVAAQYSGAKAALRPIFDELLKRGQSLGADVRVCPCKTIVPLYRKHVFAEIKATTRTRVDLGLALKDTPVPPRLIDTGGFAKRDRITHRIPLSSLAEIDEEVQRWLKAAYELNA